MQKNTKQKEVSSDKDVKDMPQNQEEIQATIKELSEKVDKMNNVLMALATNTGWSALALKEGLTPAKPDIKGKYGS